MVSLQVFAALRGLNGSWFLSAALWTAICKHMDPRMTLKTLNGKCAGVGSALKLTFPFLQNFKCSY